MRSSCTEKRPPSGATDRQPALLDSGLLSPLSHGHSYGQSKLRGKSAAAARRAAARF